MSRGPFQPGDSCNQYKIVRSLGVGGFGHVYEAVREFKVLSAGILQPFGQNVALKCLVVDQSVDPERVQRLNLEAVLLLQLKHPNIVGFIDYGITDDGTAYFAMELLQGKNLHQTLKERRFSTARSMYVAAEIAEGMAYAHEKGVIHRDLKPGNVFVTEQWDIKVLDLGAAKYKHSLKRVTHSGQLPPCTITYAAPEQLRDGEADGRADVFALATITYQMLTGHHPFCEGALTVNEQVSRQINAVARPLIERGVPDYIAEVVHRALAKRVEDRPTMEQYRDAMRAAYSRYISSGAYEDKGLAAIAERRTLRARVQKGESEPIGVPIVGADAVTKPNLLPPIDSRAPTKPVPHGLAATEFINVHASSAPPRGAATSSGQPNRSASTNTALRQASLDVAVVSVARPRRDGWTRLGKALERVPNGMKVSALGLMVLPLGFIVAGYLHKAELHADPKPMMIIAQPPAEAPPPAPVVEQVPVEEEAPAPVAAPAPAPKPRRSALHGIHTPKWDNLASRSDKPSVVVPE